MNDSITLDIVDRVTGLPTRERVMAGHWIKRLYGTSLWRLMRPLVVRGRVLPALYAGWQRSRLSRSTILPFIRRHEVDPTEFEKPVDSFRCFDEFFIRRLRPESRPLAATDAIMPADGRYLFFDPLDSQLPLHIKGQLLDLARLLGDATLANRYCGGTAILARLCPSDCHRFYFPVSGTPGPTRQLPGVLDSVNPISLWRRWSILAENRRTVCTLTSPLFGTVTLCEIGATHVGTIIQTYTPNQPVEKGAEKGYFAFGGSALLLLFEPNRLTLAPDLLSLQTGGLEVRCLIGQSLGTALNRTL
jgi:phosphatidylserine decarboxylase